LLLMGVSPIGVRNVANINQLPGSPPAETTLVVTVTVLFALVVVTLLKGKPWTALLGVVVPVALIVGAVRLARPRSPWARWRYRNQPVKLARATRREQRLREPVIRGKDRIEDLLTGPHGKPLARLAHQLPAADRMSPRQLRVSREDRRSGS